MFGISAIRRKMTISPTADDRQEKENHGDTGCPVFKEPRPDRISLFGDMTGKFMGHNPFSGEKVMSRIFRIASPYLEK